MPVHSHTHKYQRFFIDKSKKTPVFRCMLVDCSHFLRQEFVIGKKSICWFCDKEFVIGMHELGLKKPNCGCRRKSKQEIEQDDSLNDLARKLEILNG